MNNITATDSLEVYGARVHNLKTVSYTHLRAHET